MPLPPWRAERGQADQATSSGILAPLDMGAYPPSVPMPLDREVALRGHGDIVDRVSRCWRNGRASVRYRLKPAHFPVATCVDSTFWGNGRIRSCEDLPVGKEDFDP